MTPGSGFCFSASPRSSLSLRAVAVEQSGNRPRGLIASGDASYSIYLSQGLVLAAIARYAWKHVHAGVLASSMIILVMTIVSLAGRLRLLPRDRNSPRQPDKEAFREERPPAPPPAPMCNTQIRKLLPQLERPGLRNNRQPPLCIAVVSNPIVRTT